MDQRLNLASQRRNIHWLLLPQTTQILGPSRLIIIRLTKQSPFTYPNMFLVKKYETSENEGHLVISSTIANMRSWTHRSLAEKDINACRYSLTLCLVSRRSAKPAIASAAHSLAQAQIQTQNRRPRKARTGTFKLSIDQFDQLLQCKSSFLSLSFGSTHDASRPGLPRWGWSFITRLYDCATYKFWSFHILHSSNRAPRVPPMAYKADRDLVSTLSRCGLSYLIFS